MTDDNMIPLSEAQAMVAAALREAAQKIEGHCYTNNNGARSLEPVAERLRGVDQHHATVAAFIRALIPEDAGAALDRALEKARAEGLEAWQEAMLEVLAFRAQVAHGSVNLTALARAMTKAEDAIRARGEGE